jgi:hypothetical protein
LKNTTVALLKPSLSILISSIISFTTIAQKLPKIQTKSLRAPNDIKIDGKSSEWNNKFQAYNSNTGIFYTIANNDDMLFLIIQATDALIIRKIIAGNITFTINTTGKINSNGVAISYPVLHKNNWPNINLKDKPIVNKDSTINSRQVDSFMYVINKRLTGKAKEIKVKGVLSIGDTLISVYNEYGIKAASLFDDKIAYTYELAIPLKYIDLPASTEQKFSYNIKLNGSTTAEGGKVQLIEGGTLVTGVGSGNSHPSPEDMLIIGFATDFSGNYVLAKK